MNKTSWYETEQDLTPEELALKDDMNWYSLNALIGLSRQQTAESGYDPDVFNEYTRIPQNKWSMVDRHYDMSDKITDACVKYKKRRAMAIAEGKDPGPVPDKIKPFLDLTGCTFEEDEPVIPEPEPQRPPQAEYRRQQAAPQQPERRKQQPAAEQNTDNHRILNEHLWIFLSVKDRLALEKLSRRRFYEVKRNAPLIEWLLYLAITLWGSVIAFFTPHLLIAYDLIRIPIAVVYYLFRLSTGGMTALAELVGTIRTSLASLIFVFLIWFIVYDPDKTLYALNFTKTTWWKNTRIKPSEILADTQKGLYGEYVATIFLDKNKKKNNLHGKIFNSVLVPKANGDYSELDAVYVNEAGIFVVEAKARGGKLSGSLLDKSWQQGDHTMQNPLFQNHKHINSLMLNLYPKFAGTPLETKIADFSNYINTVMFGVYNITDNLNYSMAPAEVYIGMAKNFSKAKLLKVYAQRFTPEEVDQICAAIEPLADYPKEVKKEMMQEREMTRTRNGFNAPVYYSVVNIGYTRSTFGDQLGRYTICQESCGEAVYLDLNTNWYTARPNCKVYSKVNCQDEGQALAMLNQHMR